MMKRSYVSKTWALLFVNHGDGLRPILKLEDRDETKTGRLRGVPELDRLVGAISMYGENMLSRRGSMRGCTRTNFWDIELVQEVLG